MAIGLTSLNLQQYALAPANYVTPIPDALSSEDAAPMLCAGVTSKSTASSDQEVTAFYAASSAASFCGCGNIC